MDHSILPPPCARTQLANKGILYTYKGSGVLHCLAYSPERKLLFVGSSSGDIVGLAVSDNALAMRYSLAGGHKGVWACTDMRVVACAPHTVHTIHLPTIWGLAQSAS